MKRFQYKLFPGIIICCVFIFAFAGCSTNMNTTERVPQRDTQINNSSITIIPPNEKTDNTSPNTKKPHAILDKYSRIVGGSLDGKWYNRGEMAKYIVGGEKYKIYSQTQFLGEYGGSKPHEESYFTGPKGYRIKIGNRITWPGMVVGISGDWNALPRIPTTDNTKFVTKDTFISNLLNKNGILNVPVQIISRIDIDLDNDGINETFITASNISDEIIQDVCSRKAVNRDNLYSIVVLRKTVSGKETNTVLLENYKICMINEVQFIADIDGDGQMEFMINNENIEATPAEGVSVSRGHLFDIEKDAVKKIFVNFSNPV